MKSRDFIKLSSMTDLGLSLPVTNLLIARGKALKEKQSPKYKKRLFELVQDWCNGLIETQIIKPSGPKVHELFDCPACDSIHARVMEAIYPFFCWAKETREQKSWDGTTVFGAVALAETLKHHGCLLDKSTRERWYKRLESSTEFVYNRFNLLSNDNINYGATTIHALNLTGELLNKPKYINRNKWHDSLDFS